VNDGLWSADYTVEEQRARDDLRAALDRSLQTNTPEDGAEVHRCMARVADFIEASGDPLWQTKVESMARGLHETMATARDN